MQLTIEKLVYGGDGLARTAPDDEGRRKAVFVPLVLTGEKVEAEKLEEKPGFIRARAGSILTSSEQRIEPKCPYFGRCGGCHYQHTSYENQVEIKRTILAETLQRIAKIELEEPPVAHTGDPWNYRNRTRMRVRGGSRFAIGYYRLGSHELQAVETCPISSPLINEALAVIWKLGRAGLMPHSVEEIEFFANHDDTALLLEANLNDHATSGIGSNLAAFVENLRRELPAIAGVAVFRRRGETLRHELIPHQVKDIFGAQSLTYRTTHCEYQVSAGSFFQTNRHMTNVMVDIATKGRTGRNALDLYSGVGLFTLPLSRGFAEVAAVEAAPYSYHDLRRNCPENVSAYHADTGKFLDDAAKLAKFDYIVIDPPRGGMGEVNAQKLAFLGAPRITYVSCDPATFARDLHVLLGRGYRIHAVHLIDLFPQTYHIESMVELSLS